LGTRHVLDGTARATPALGGWAEIPCIFMKAVEFAGDMIPFRPVLAYSQAGNLIWNVDGGVPG